MNNYFGSKATSGLCQPIIIDSNKYKWATKMKCLLKETYTLITKQKSKKLTEMESHVPFTNNRAERYLRMSKVKRKVSGSFKNQSEC